MTRAEKRLDREIEKSYYRQCAGTQIEILNIPKLFRDARQAVAMGGNLDQAVGEAIQRYAVNPETSDGQTMTVERLPSFESQHDGEGLPETPPRYSGEARL